jgi:GNAT superfamily N-acetyltransferase
MMSRRLTASSSITLARVGGLSPVKQRNDAAPERKGFWAFIWPNIEPFLLGSTTPEGLAGHESNVEVYDEMYALQKEMESIMRDQGWDKSTETWEDAAYTRNYGVEHRRLMRKHRELDSKIKNPSRGEQYARGIEKLRKFKYQGLLWTRLPTRNKTIRSVGDWNLVDAGDLAKIARKAMAREMGDAYGRGLPANYSKGTSGDHWEVFVPARSGQIRSAAAHMHFEHHRTSPEAWGGSYRDRRHRALGMRNFDVERLALYWPEAPESDPRVQLLGGEELKDDVRSRLDPTLMGWLDFEGSKRFGIKIHMVRAREDYRGKGIAKALFNELLRIYGDQTEYDFGSIRHPASMRIYEAWKRKGLNVRGRDDLGMPGWGSRAAARVAARYLNRRKA